MVPKKRFLVSSILAIGIFIGAFYFIPAIHRPLEQCSAYLIYPMLKFQQCIIIPVKNYWNQRIDHAALQQQLAALSADKESLQAEVIELRSLIDYMQDIKEIAEFKQEHYSNQGVLAQILTRNCSEQSHFCLIDRGTRHGIKSDMIAVYKNCIVGKVAQVYPCYSKVLLITDHSCKIGAVCTKSKALGIYQGVNEAWRAGLEHVSHLAALEENDMVISSGEGLIFPRGFGLGRVKTFVRNDLFYQVTLEPLIDVRAITHCYLLEKGAAISGPLAT